MFLYESIGVFKVNAIKTIKVTPKRTEKKLVKNNQGINNINIKVCGGETS